MNMDTPEQARQRAEYRASKGIKHSFWWWFAVIFFFPFILMWWMLKFTLLAIFGFITIPLYTARHFRAKQYKRAKAAEAEAKHHKEVSVTISSADLDKLKQALK